MLSLSKIEPEILDAETETGNGIYIDGRMKQTRTEIVEPTIPLTTIAINFAGSSFKALYRHDRERTTMMGLGGSGYSI